MFDWLSNNEVLFWWLGTFSLAIIIISMIAIPFLVSRIPVDYFVRDLREHRARCRHSVVDYSVLVLKYFLGTVLLLAGIAMLVLPGPGIISILTGIMLIDFPGKLMLERYIAQKPPIARSINWLRKKTNRPPLQF